jgi:hypothetical protein
MLFDCVRVRTSLGFHWICNRKKKGGICELMMISILNHFSLLRMLVIFDWWKHINMDVTLPFWVIMRSGRRNMMNHTASRGSYLVVLSSGCGDFVFTMSHTATRASSWPYMDFWTFKSFVTSVSGWSYAPIWEMGVSMALYGSLHPSLSFWGAWKTTLPTTLVWWYGRHHNLIDRCEISISQMTMDLFT